MRDGDEVDNTQPHPETLSDIFGVKTRWPFMRDGDKRKSVFFQAVTKSALDHEKVLTNMDVFSLFDKVLLHELTHTRPGGATVDVRIPSPPFLKEHP